MYNKYSAKKTVWNGKTYDSKKEAARAQDLYLLQKAREIDQLQEQVEFPVEINGKHVFTYIADFAYFDKLKNKYVVEDVKGYKAGPAWSMFSLKKKCVEAQYNIEIKVV